MILRRLVFFAFFVISPGAALSVQAADSNAELARYADQLFSKAYAANEPGAAVLVAKDGQALLRKGYGMASVELGVPMQPDGVFEIASITKEFTAAAILMLQDRGKLSLDDEITKYLPEYPTHGQKITIFHLLTHTSGVPDFTALPEWWPRMREDMSVQQILGLFKDKPLEFTPGEKQGYSNSGYTLLGAIIEKVSGKSYEDFMEQEMLAPLGMTRSRNWHPAEIVPGFVTGYDKEENGYRTALPISMTQSFAAGSLLSTVDDLALWAEALPSGKLLKRETFERMTTPVKLASGQTTKGGYGIQVFEENGKRILAHGGGVPGFNSYLLSIPGEHLVVAVLSNVLGHDPGPGGLAYRVAMKALGQPVEDRKPMNLDPVTLDGYVGLYRFDERVTRAVFREGNKLFAQRMDGDPHEIFAASHDDFFYPDSDARIHFRRNAKGKVTGMDFQYSFGPADETGMKLDDPGLNLAFADTLASQDELSGTVLVARNGKVLLQKAWGLADREKGTPVTLDTQFRVGSMNKMFTSVATLQLVEAGKLALDDPIGKYLPDYPNKDVATKVTVRHLLTHTGGTGDIFGPEFMKNRLALKEHGDYLKLYGSRGLTHEPGAQFEYSNYGFVLLGAILEKVTGMSYYDYVRSRVFQPAGMTSTDSLPETENVPNRAAGYMRDGGGWVPNTDTLPWRGTSAGGGYSTVGDLLRFAQALESGKLISKAMFAEATRQNPRRYGYGFQVEGEGRSRSYGHSGGAPGINGALRVFPELGYVVVGLSNLDPPSVSRVVDSLALRIQVTQ